MKGLQDEFFPKDWLAFLTHELDFEAAFARLRGEGLSVESLRGFVRRLQLRTRDAWVHFRNAERLLEADTELRDEDREVHVALLEVRKVENAILEDAMGVPGSKRRTDSLVLQLVEGYIPDRKSLVEVAILNGAFFQLIRGQFAPALATLEELLEHGRKFHDQQIAFHCGAAGAARELGFESKAERHLEGAVLGMSMLSVPFKIALYSSQIYALLTHWGRHDDAGEWLARVNAIECPDETKTCFVKRAHIFAEASKREKTLYIA